MWISGKCHKNGDVVFHFKLVNFFVTLCFNRFPCDNLDNDLSHGNLGIKNEDFWPTYVMSHSSQS
jgi:hypothetical protein